MLRSEPEKWGIDTERAKLALPMLAGIEEELRNASN